MVPKCIGYFSEYREVTGTPRGINGPQWALVEKREGRPEVACAPLAQSELDKGRGRRPPPSFSSLLFPFFSYLD